MPHFSGQLKKGDDKFIYFLHNIHTISIFPTKRQGFEIILYYNAYFLCLLKEKINYKNKLIVLHEF